jgi:hypothetical protein
MKDSLTLLKLRLLLQALDRVPNAEQHALVIDQANRASFHARATPFPELMLPCLFEELMSTALQTYNQRERLYWHGLQLIDTPARASSSAVQMERPNMRNVLTKK